MVMELVFGTANSRSKSRMSGSNINSDRPAHHGETTDLPRPGSFRCPVVSATAPRLHAFLIQSVEAMEMLVALPMRPIWKAGNADLFADS